MNYTLNFTELGKDDAPIAGGKGASLGEMIQAGIPVPGGYVVLADTFEAFLKETDLMHEIDSILHEVNHEVIHTVEKASEAIQGLILSRPMPEVMQKEIQEKFQALGSQYVAVRSSATAEDGAEHAWAGQLDSYLNTTESDLIEKVRKCWASLFTPRAIFYRFEKGLHTTKISVAVVVQKMVNSEISGIAFSVHPVTEDYNQLIIEAGFGLGEAIVSGSVTPDSYVVEKNPRNILDINISDQGRAMYRIEGGGSEWKNLEPSLGSSQVLDEARIHELSDIILRIEQHYGFPCDIEWAAAFEESEGSELVEEQKFKFYIVQSRPITTLTPPAGGVAENNANKESPEEGESSPFISPVLQDFKVDEWQYDGLWKNDLFATCFWQDCFVPEVVAELGINLDRAGVMNLQGGHYLVHKPTRAIMDRQIKKMIDERNEVFFKNFVDVSNRIFQWGVEKGDFLSTEEPTLENFRDFVATAKKLNFLWLIAATYTNWPVEEKLGEAVVEAKFPPERVLDIIPTIITPLHHYHKGLVALRKRIGNKTFEEVQQDARLSDALAKQAEEYIWVETFNFIGETTTPEKIYGAISYLEEKSDTHKTFDTNNLSEKLHFVADCMHAAGYVKQGGAEYFSIFSRKAIPFLERVAESLGLTYREMMCLSTHEVDQALEGQLNTQDLKKKARERIGANNWAVIGGKGGEFIYIDEPQDIATLVDTMIPRIDEGTRELRGQIGNRGTYSGRVCVVMNTYDFDKLAPEDVLVTTMTTPDFIILMQKSGAIVTDIGGLLCHAAIVSRELGKPCVIGTKFATQMLHDGDLVEVDADNGVVKILETKNSGKEEISLEEPKDEKTLEEEYLDLSKGKKLYPALKSYSAFMLGAGFHLKKYCEKWYSKEVSFDLLILMKEGFGEAWLPEEYMKLTSQIGLQEYIRDVVAFEKRMAYFSESCPMMDRMYTENTYTKISQMSEEALLTLLEKIRDLTWDTNAPTVCVNDVDKQMCWETLGYEGFGITREEFDEVWDKASEPAFESIDKVQEKEFLSLLSKKVPWSDTLEACQYFLTNYYSAQNLLVVENSLKQEYTHFLNDTKKVSQELEQLSLDAEKITDAHQEWLESLSEKKQVFAQYLYLVMVTRDRRKSFLNKGLTIMYRIAEEIFKREGIENSLIPYYTVDELLGGSKYLTQVRSELEKRKKGFKLLIKYSGEVDMQSEDIERATEKVNEYFIGATDISAESSVILGQIGSKGNVQGRVRVVFDVQAKHGFQNGEILVTGMTRPEFVPLMKLAAGIVTDEGGITCHAAIVSRELGKPCVIGTKFATQMLNDGDMVEVDADNGVVRILEPNNQTAKKSEREKITFVKAYERDFTLALEEYWARGFLGTLLPKLGLHPPASAFEIFFVTEENMQIWENKAAIDWMLEELLRLNREGTSFMESVIAEYLPVLRDIEAFWKCGPLDDYEALKEYIDLLKNGAPLFSLWYYPGTDERTPADVMKLVMTLREKDEFFARNDLYLKECIEKLGGNRRFANLVLCDEFPNLPNSETLEKRASGIVSVDGRERSVMTLTEFAKAHPEYEFEGLFDTFTEVSRASGQVAQKGKVQGRVCIVKNKFQMEGIAEGDILVSPMTTPDFISAMHRAGAFVTDEGGVMCHAAIVARELGKPCIIGTKIATQILKNGDLVEVDAERGVVTILEKAQDKDDRAQQMVEEYFERTTDAKGYYTYRATFSPLLIFVSWTEREALPYIDGLALSKGRDAFFALHQEKYLSYAEKMIVAVTSGTRTLESLRAEYVSLDEEISLLYDQHCTADVAQYSDEGLATLMQSSALLLTKIASRTLYLETLDHEMLLRVLGSESKATLDGIWDQATELTFLSFEARRLGTLTELAEQLSENEACKHAAYIYTDYWWTKPKDYIQQELEAIQSDLVENKKTYQKMVRTAEKQKKQSQAWLKTLSPEVALLAGYIQLIMELRDVRKDPIAKTQALEVLVATEMIQRAGMDMQYAPYVTNMEYGRGVEYLRTIKEEIERRPEGFVWSSYGFWEHQTALGDFDELHSLFVQKQGHTHSVHEDGLQGSVGYKGKATGVVRVVMDAEHVSAFHPGDILVTSMTRPEFIPLMKMAAAFVTNEGGITCHAAIVAREMQKPCIIGTKIATQVLHDGDLVEVDADNGLVKILGTVNVPLPTDGKLQFPVARRYTPLMTDIFMRAYDTHEYYYHLYGRPGTVTMAYVDGVYYHTKDIMRFAKSTLASWRLQDKSLLDFFESMYRVGSALLKNVEEAKSKTYTTKEGLFTELSILIKDFEQFATSLIGWSFQIPIAEELRKLVLADGNEDEAIAVLSFPDKENIALTEQQALYAIGAKVQKAGVKKYTELAQEIETDIEEHIKQYGWINARGGFTEEWTPEEIFDRIIDEQADFAQKITELVVSRAESQTKSQALVRELSLSEEQQKTVAIAKELVYFRTYRTDTINQVAFCMQPLLEQVAEYLRITHEAVTSLTVDELLTGRIPAEEVLERRTQNYFSMTNPGGLPVMVDDPDEIAILVQEHLLVVEVEEGHLKGNTAYKGLVCGKVRLLRSKQDIAKVQKGEILVTTMTTPNMIPAMEKAVGFVTDEGGITCHAAIIAREMKKPCVIATKVATKVLKDGDMIELDADNGIVRIFEKG